MNPHTPRFDAQDLLHHAGFLRGIARALVADEHRAEDVVQQAWVAALEKGGPGPPGGARAWLARVTRNLALNLRHREGQRADRERHAARPERVDPPDALQGELERQREVAEVLAGLGDPLGPTLYLRYFDGLSPREIARRQGVSPETVKTRLRRGLERMRAELDRRHGGDRRAWCLGLASLAARGGALSVPGAMAPATLHSAAIGLAGVVAMLAIAGGLWIWSGGDGERQARGSGEQVATAPKGEHAAAASGSALDTPVDPLDGRDPVAIGREPRARAAGALEVRVRGRAVDESGRPLPGADVRLTSRPAIDLGQELEGWVPDEGAWQDPEPLASGPDGRFELAFGPLPGRRFFELALQMPGRAPGSWSWTGLVTGQVLDLGDLELGPACVLIVHVVDGEGNALTDGWSVSADPVGHAREGARYSQHHRVRLEGGEARFVDLPEGRVEVEASSRLAGRIESRYPDVAPDRETHLELKYDGPDLATRIVLSLASSPVRHFRIDAESLVLTTPEGRELHPRRPKGTTGWVWDGLGPGDYAIEVRNPLFEPWHRSGIRPGSWVHARLRGSAAVRLDLRHADTGQPIEDYELRIAYRNATFFPNVFPVFTGETLPPADGLVEGLIPGSFALAVTVPGWPERDLEIRDLRPGELRAVERELGPPGSGLSISGIVVRSDGRTPMDGVEVTLTRGERAGHDLGPGASIGGGADGPVPRIEGSIRSGAGGDFEFADLEPGEWTLRAVWGDHLCRDEVVTLDVNPVANLILSRPPAGSIRGRLLLPQGANAGRLSVSLRGDAVRTYLAGHESQGVEEDGGFRFEGVPVGTVWIQLEVSTEHSLYGGMSVGEWLGKVVIAPERTTEPVFDLRQTLRGVARVHIWIDGRPATGGFCLVRHMDGTGASGSAIAPDGLSEPPAGPPGPCLIEVQAEDGSWTWTHPEPVVVPPGGDVEVDVRVPLDERTVVFLHAGTNQPLAGRDVEWIAGSAPGQEPAGARTDDLGLLSLNLPPGEVSFRLTAEGAQPMAVEWRKGEDLLEVSLHVPQ